MALTDRDLSITNELKNRLLSIDGEHRIRKVILYGSRARGTANVDSDYDILVIEKDPVAKRDEMRRFRRALGSLPCELDLWVMGSREFEETKEIIGGMAFPAHKYGQVLYEIEARQDELARDIKEANREFREGRASPTTPDDLMKEITSR